jgi:hypothetical protein
MTDTSWLTDNWPWFCALFLLVVYEFCALANHKRTLSRMVWTSAKKYPWMVPIIFSFLVWLLIHFFVTKGTWAIELPITGVLVFVIWSLYRAWTRKVEPNA